MKTTSILTTKKGQVIELRADYTSSYYEDLCKKSGVAFFRYPVAKDMSSIKEMVELFPKLCELIDRGNFYIACAQGLHRTDIALCTYWVFHAADMGMAPPPIRGYRKDKGLDTNKIMRILNGFYKRITTVETLIPVIPEAMSPDIGFCNACMILAVHGNPQSSCKDKLFFFL